jgi:hypothetical protein
MSTDPKYTSSGKSPNSDKRASPEHRGGSAQQNAEKWSGGSKAAKGGGIHTGKHNENSTGKS